jgi:hypothetical protein
MTAKADKPLQVFFDHSRGGYWLKLSESRYLPLDSGQLNLHLRHAGLYSGKMEAGALNDCERAMIVAMTERWVSYAGPLAGHRCGMFTTSSGDRVLVTSEPGGRVFSVPKCPTTFRKLERFLEQLFGPEQLPYVLSWLKCARASLRHGDFRPGQILILAGPSNCGKSLFQALVTEFLGGRSARPFRYMTGQTSFNGDLAMAEHLIIEDESASSDIRARRKFGSSIKDFSVNKEMSVHPKGRQAVALPTFKRITISVNSEPENLMICPPMDESILDKVHLFKCEKANVPGDRKEAWECLSGELENLAAWLHIWRVPRSMTDSRFGVRAYHNPSLLELLSEVSAEMRLLSIIDQLEPWGRKGQDGKFWRGTAAELESLLQRSEFNFSVQKLLYWDYACGAYLGRLAQQCPWRVEGRKNQGRGVWILRAP